MNLSQFSHFQSQLVASGLSAAAYCRQSNIAYHTYLYFKRKAATSNPSPKKMKPATSSGSHAANNFSFLELVATDKSAPPTLSATNIHIEVFGIRLICPQNFSKEQWVALLAAVKEVSAC